MPKWEYASISVTWYAGPGMRAVDGYVIFSHNDEERRFGEGELMKTLRRLGDDGWELVSTHRTIVGEMEHTLNGQDLFFKRQLD